MKTKIARVLVAAAIASSLILAGTAHAGLSQPGGNSVVLSTSK